MVEIKELSKMLRREINSYLEYKELSKSNSSFDEASRNSKNNAIIIGSIIAESARKEVVFAKTDNGISVKYMKIVLKALYKPNDPVLISILETIEKYRDKNIINYNGIERIMGLDEIDEVNRKIIYNSIFDIY